MYYYWKTKGILPSTFYSLPKGELLVIRAFYEMEIDEKVKIRKSAEKSGMFCPSMLGGMM